MCIYYVTSITPKGNSGFWLAEKHFQQVHSNPSQKPNTNVYILK